MAVLFVGAAGWVSAAVFFALAPALGAAGACALAGLFLLLVLAVIIMLMNRDSRPATTREAVANAADPAPPRTRGEAIARMVSNPAQGQQAVKGWVAEHPRETLAIMFGIGIAAGLNPRTRSRLLGVVTDLAAAAGTGMASQGAAEAARHPERAPRI